MVAACLLPGVPIDTRICHPPSSSAGKTSSGTPGGTPLAEAQPAPEPEPVLRIGKLAAARFQEAGGGGSPILLGGGPDAGQGEETRCGRFRGKRCLEVTVLVFFFFFFFFTGDDRC